jgi:hypothetical protein
VGRADDVRGLVGIVDRRERQVEGDGQPEAALSRREELDLGVDRGVVGLELLAAGDDP